MGLVAVALLTLAPLALRPVRLACLIHAANVHSEPGSNPSKVGGRAVGPRRAPRRASLLRVEECLTGRTGSASRPSKLGPSAPPLPVGRPVPDRPRPHSD